MKKPKIGKKAVIIIAVIGAVAGLGIWGVSSLVSRLRAAGGPGFQTAEAVSGTIESTVTGTGSLEYEDASEVRVPAGLEITSVLKESGSRVQKGELLAGVEKTGCEIQMSELFQQIAEVDEQLRDTPPEPETLEIRAPVAGQVLSSHISAGASVLDVLSSFGTLVSISPGGSMGADIQLDGGAAVSPGETVVLDFGDGSTKTAVVEETTASSFTAALSGSAGNAQGNVTAKTPQGAVLGTGGIRALDAVEAVAPAGTIEKVAVSAGEKVSAGQLLFTVRPSGHSAAFLEQEHRRKALTNEYDSLAAIYKNGGITAPISGTIVTCAVRAGQNTSSLEGAAASFPSLEQSGVQLPAAAQDALGMFGAGMSIRTSDAGTEYAFLSAQADPGSEPESAEESGEPQETIPAQEEPSDSQPTAPQHEDREIPRIEVPLVPPIAGLPLQTELGVLPIYVGTVAWEPEDVQAQYSTTYTARVELEALDGFVFADDCTATVLYGEVADTEADGRALSFTVTFPETVTPPDLSGIDWETISSFLNEAGQLDLSGLRDILAAGLLDSAALGFDLGDLYSQIDPSALYGQIDPSALAGQFDTSAFAGQMDAASLAGALGGAAIPSYDPSMLYEAAGDYGTSTEPVAFTIAPDDTMQIVIQINQMDILAVREGMHCAVTVDALPDREFEGTVQSVAEAASGSGDYTAKIIVEKDPDMRAGMTASATIVTQESEDVLTIPVSALQEDGNRVFVYTGYDASSGEFTGEVDVVTGVSNGSEVQILEGLEPGQTVFFAQTDPLRQIMSMMNGGQGGDGAPPDSTYVPPEEAIATP